MDLVILGGFLMAVALGLRLWSGRAYRIVMVAALCLLALLIFHRMVEVTPEALRARIARDLPVGTRSDRVLSFLDSLGTEHSTLVVSLGGTFQREPLRSRRLCAVSGGGICLRMGSLWSSPSTARTSWLDFACVTGSLGRRVGAVRQMVIDEC